MTSDPAQRAENRAFRCAPGRTGAQRAAPLQKNDLARPAAVLFILFFDGGAGAADAIAIAAGFFVAPEAGLPLGSIVENPATERIWADFDAVRGAFG